MNYSNMVMEYREVRDKLQANTKLEMERDMTTMMTRAPALWTAPNVGGISSLLFSLSWPLCMVEFAAMKVWWL